VTDRSCSIDACERKHLARGYCSKHYQQIRPDPLPRPSPICSIEDCAEPRIKRGWCDKHYQRWKHRGTTDLITREQRFWKKVDKSGDCWNWTGTVNADGYGQFWKGNGKRCEPAHRYAYRLLVGTIPEGLQIDHICHNPPCVNPDHLRLATCKQNQENRAGAAIHSSSGVRGVCWSKKHKSWTAQVGHHGKQIWVGGFDTIEEAEQAVIAKRNELFTHHVPT
jgi:hypothetical protein